MVYLIFSGEYSDWNVIGYLETRDEADRYCISKNGNNPERYSELYVVEANKLSIAGMKHEHTKILREHEVVFDIKDGKPKCRLGETDRYKLYFGTRRKTVGKIYDRNPSIFEVYVTTDKREKAEKIAIEIANKHFDKENLRWL